MAREISIDTVQRSRSAASTAEVGGRSFHPREVSIDGSMAGGPQPAGGDMSFGGRALGGLLGGLKEDSITGFLYRNIMEEFPEANQQAVEGFIHRAQRGGFDVGDVTKFVGEYAPTLLAGFGAFGLGKLLAVKGVAKFGAKKGLESSLGRVAGRHMVGGQVAQHAKYGKEGVRQLIAKPGIEQIAEVVGGGAGFGALTGVEELLDGHNLSQAGREALLNMVLVGGLDATMRGTFKMFFASARAPKIAEAEKNFLTSGAPELFIAREAEQAGVVGKFATKYNDIMGVGQQQQELLRTQLNAKTLKKARELGQEYRKAKTGLHALQQAMDDPVSLYTRATPLNPGVIGTAWKKFLLQTLHTTESLKGQLGRVGTKVTERFDAADKIVLLEKQVHNGAMLDAEQAAGKLLGFSKREMLEGRKFLDVLHHWESLKVPGGGGADGVRAYMASLGKADKAEEMVGIFQKADARFRSAYKPVEQMGAEHMQSRAQLARKGVKEYWPHQPLYKSDEELFAAYAKVLGTEKALEHVGHFKGSGLAKNASIDHARRLPGSLRDKVELGLPFNPHPFDGGFRYLHAVSQRTHFGKVAGLDGEMAQELKDLAIKEGASPAVLNTVFDLFLNHKYVDEGMRHISKIVTGLQTAAKLPFGVIPNATQSSITAMFNGFKATMHGVTDLANKEKRRYVEQSIGILDSSIRDVGVLWGEAGLRAGVGETGATAFALNASDALAKGVLKYTLFDTFEQWNRRIAGSTGRYVFRDLLGKGMEGKLRGNTLDIARRRMESVGVNLDETVQLALRGGDDYFKTPAFQQLERLATFNGSIRTQFNPTATRRPTAWNHPVGRVLSQFKTFALGYGKFLRDQVFAEAAHGNVKPLAAFLSLYPIMGEMVGDVRSLAKGKGREQEGVYRLVSNFSAMGGLGMVGDTYTGLGFGRGLEWALGPTVSDFSQFLENMVQRDAYGFSGQVMRTPIVQASRSLAGVSILSTALLHEYVSEVTSGETEGRTTVDLGELRTGRR